MLTEKLFIEPPCIFCGYEGPNFYQAGSHKPNCPYHNIGGAFKREQYIVEMAREMRVVVTPEPITTKTEWRIKMKFGNRWSCQFLTYKTKKEASLAADDAIELFDEVQIIRREIREYVEENSQ